MKTALNIKQFRFYLWVALGYLGLQMFIDLTHSPEPFFLATIDEIWKLFYIIAINYFFLEYTIPKLSWKRAFTSFFLLVFQILLYSWGLYTWRALGIQLHIYTPYKTYPSIEKGVADHFGEGLFSLIFFGVTRHIYNYNSLKKATQQLRIEKQEAELNYLKSQTNPHFLFNTLNNIYSLARDKSDLAPESILRLSKILRFMLYEAGGAYIAIEEELKIISDYIALESLRYDESLHVNFNYDVEDMKQSLPPLLLMPLVENAFKHGVSETRSRPFVDVHLSVNKRQLAFFVKNSMDTATDRGSIKENIGLSNLRRQLELLYKEYDLSVQQSDSQFTAILKINLASHV